MTVNDNLPKAAPGFHRYTPQEFGQYFNASDDLALQITNDYYQIVNAPSQSIMKVLDHSRERVMKEIESLSGAFAQAAFTDLAIRVGLIRNLPFLATLLESRYQMPSKKLRPITQFLADTASVRINQERQLALGITRAKWNFSTCGIRNVPYPGHEAANGKTFLISKGLKIHGESILPGALIECGCLASSIIPGLED